MVSQKGVDKAQQVSFTCYDHSVMIKDIEILGKKLHNVVLTKGEILKFRHKGDIVELIVLNHIPEPGVVVITEDTKIFLQHGDYKSRLDKMKELLI